MVTRKTPAVRIALAAAFLVLVLALVPAALAGKPGGGGGGGKGGGGTGGGSCIRNTPGVTVANTWQWGTTGSWGLAGQQLTYAISVINADAGCSSSSFVVSLSAPDGFSVSIPTNSISLSSGASGYVWATVTSPSAAVDGNYPLTATVTRVGGSSPAASDTSYYKVYSTDTVAPSLYWVGPGDGQTITGKSFNFTATSNDDHEVQRIELYIDNTLWATQVCNDIGYDCDLYTAVSLTGLQGQHTATFQAYDWLGNVRSLTVSFTVG
jgi:Big-like domain-containing protein/alpha-galactosidase-like protein